MGDISQNFDRREFTCRCNCGQDTVDVELLQLCEQVRRMNGGYPLTINSGNRCPDYNKAVGGVPQSQHVKSRAADLPVRNPDLIYEMLCSAWPDRYGFGLYLEEGFVHVDSRKNKARWGKK